ncbi:MAG: tRNA (guanine(10)-N(2))-dimethyltransferase [Archaeoglobales archaeon]|nr:tRNA (guanine(10)-N(2))-dimethyltransferase [Archaeoglobales archaeon]
MIFEGKAKIETDGVFYNPRMKFCRNLDMKIYAVIDSKEYLDALAASGVRGIRAKIEASKMSSFNDANPKAVEVIKKNLKLNEIDAEVYNEDASLLMRRKKFEHIDLDPFGSPAQFMDSACYSAKRFLSITATDTAALCGSSKSSELRKYGVYAIKTDAYWEIGLRVLIGFVCREATKYEKVALPIASWAKEHYYRVHFRIKRSTSQSAKIYEKIGFIFYCPRCCSKLALPLGDVAERCSCGEKFSAIGPLWIGELKDVEVIKKAVKIAEPSEIQEKKFLESILNELDLPTAYSISHIAKRLRISPPSTEKLIEKLEELGYKASRTHYCGFCFKTNAEIEEIEKIIYPLSRV